MFYNVYSNLLLNKYLACGTYTKPKEKNITILIPCFGKAKYIEEVTQSCVNQTMKAYQIIILLMDEESQKLKNKLESLADNINCIIHEKLNVSKARNYLVNICPTEYFFLLDADDTISSNALEECYKQKESIVAVPKNDLGRIVGICKQNGSTPSLVGLWHKEVWKELGGLNENLTYFEDLDFKIKLIELKKWNVGLAWKANFIYNEFTENNSQKSISFFDKEKCGKIMALNKKFIYYPDTFNYDFNGLNNFLIVKEDSIDIKNFDLFVYNTSYRQKIIKLIFDDFEVDCEKYFDIIKNIFYYIKNNNLKINIILGENATEWPPFFQEKIYNILNIVKNNSVVYVETNGNNKQCVFYSRNDIILLKLYRHWNKDTKFDDLQKNEIPVLEITNSNINDLEKLLQLNNLIYFNCLVDFNNVGLVKKLLILKRIYKKLTFRTSCNGDLITFDFTKNKILSCPFSEFRTEKKINDYNNEEIFSNVHKEKQCINCVKNGFKIFDDDYDNEEIYERLKYFIY